MTKFSIALMIGASVTACGNKKDGAASELVSQATEMKTRACACKDSACTAKVSTEMEAIAKKLGAKDLVIAIDDATKVDALIYDTIQCKRAIIQAATTPEGNLEARLQLNKLAKNAKTYVITNSSFVKGKASTLPAGDCCSLPAKKCAVDAAGWTGDKVWAELDFQIDVPSELHYTYESSADGMSFTATATGDPGCTGTSATYTATGTIVAGTPKVDFTGP